MYFRTKSRIKKWYAQDIETNAFYEELLKFLLLCKCENFNSSLKNMLQFIRKIKILSTFCMLPMSNAIGEILFLV